MLPEHGPQLVQRTAFRQFRTVSAVELGEPFRVVSEPLAQFITRCDRLQPEVDLGLFLTDTPRPQAVDEDAIAVGGFGRGGTVTATVSCRVELSDLGLVFLPGATTVSASSTAPVDTWRGTR